MNGSEAQRSEAEGQLAAIRDPAAVGPLVNLLGGDSESVRLMLARTSWGRSPAATRRRRSSAASWPSPTRRSARRRSTPWSRGRRPTSRDGSCGPSSSKDQVVVGRAAWALAALRVNVAVPKLVNVLVKTEQKIVVVQTNNGPTAPVYGFNSLGPGAMFGNGSSLGLYTAPVVGPGVVAYGAVGVP